MRRRDKIKKRTFHRNKEMHGRLVRFHVYSILSEVSCRQNVEVKLVIIKKKKEETRIGMALAKTIEATIRKESLISLLLVVAAIVV